MTMDEATVADTATEAAPAGESPLRDKVIDALRTVYDPEIPVNIYELGLIYDIAIDAAGEVAIEMTLTAPACPVAGTMPGTVQEAVSAVPGVSKVEVELVWDPPWDQSRMSEAAQLELGFL
jgi:FeS assembly SUF system protein